MVPEESDFITDFLSYVLLSGQTVLVNITKNHIQIPTAVLRIDF